jgi:flagellar motility protein MotE (MotC chaperone)
MTAMIISGDESYLEASFFNEAYAEEKATKPESTMKSKEEAKDSEVPEKPVEKLKHEMNDKNSNADQAKEDLQPPKELEKKESFDPFNLSEGEVKLLFTLDKKRKELDRREQEIKESQKQLQVVQKRVDQKIDELKNIKVAIKKIVQQEDEQVSKNTQRLVGIYQGMKPKSAAKVFDGLPMSVLKKVIQKMDQKKVSPILAVMDIKKVKKLTTLLAQPSPLDLPQKRMNEDPTEMPADNKE